mmetsp:Transcript_38363/g.90993  ORF Transcript_38363/g.90993 Transcript_38363/m.90993 type:complete len:243 (-) Transcript_38363:296-1024(-)
MRRGHAQAPAGAPGDGPRGRPRPSPEGEGRRGVLPRADELPPDARHDGSPRGSDAGGARAAGGPLAGGPQERMLRGRPVRGADGGRPDRPLHGAADVAPDGHPRGLRRRPRDRRHGAERRRERRRRRRGGVCAVRPEHPPDPQVLHVHHKGRGPRLPRPGNGVRGARDVGTGGRGGAGGGARGAEHDGDGRHGARLRRAAGVRPLLLWPRRQAPAGRLRAVPPRRHGQGLRVHEAGRWDDRG